MNLYTKDLWFIIIHNELENVVVIFSCSYFTKFWYHRQSVLTAYEGKKKKKKPHICGACNKVINSNFRVAYFIYVLFIQFAKLFIMSYMVDFEPIKHGINLSFNMIKSVYKKKRKI